MTTQAQLDAQLEKAARDYAKLNAKQQRFAIREIDRTRLELIDLLNEYAKKDDTISKARINSLLRDLEVLERNIRETGIAALEAVVSESATFATTASAAAVGGIAFDRIDDLVFKYVVNRFGDDGLVLSDRVWQLAGDQRDALNNVIRSAIIRGESVSQMTARVREVYDNETWKIRRLVVTEGNTAYRVGTAYYADRSDVVKGVKVNDHNDHSRHHTHKCYDLANAVTPLGVGVYRPDDSRVYMIHPNCSAYLTYVLKDDEREVR